MWIVCDDDGGVEIAEILNGHSVLDEVTNGAVQSNWRLDELNLSEKKDSNFIQTLFYNSNARVVLYAKTPELSLLKWYQVQI